MIGRDDIIVVSTSYAVLVAAQENAEQVKALVEHLKASRGPAPANVLSMGPWGYYQEVDAAERYRVSCIVVVPGGDALAADALPSRRALGRGQRNGRGHRGR